MKKFTIVLSTVAIMASALFVSCIKPNNIVPPPAFPAENIATILEKQSYTATYDYSWQIEPNYDWTATIEESSREHIQFLTSTGYSNPTYGHTISGGRGINVLYINILKTPAEDEEAVTVKINITMQGETRPLATFTIDPYEYIKPIFPKKRKESVKYNPDSDDLYDLSWQFEPNCDWTATIEEDATDYIEFLVTPLDAEEAGYDSELRGKSGLSMIYLRVKNGPASGEADVVAKINLTMFNEATGEDETNTIAEITIQPADE